MPSLNLEQFKQHLFNVYDNTWRVTAETLKKEGKISESLTGDALRSVRVMRQAFVQKLEQHLSKIERKGGGVYSLHQPDVALSLLEVQGRLGQAVIDFQKLHSPSSAASETADDINRLDVHCASADDYKAAIARAEGPAVPSTAAATFSSDADKNTLIEQLRQKNHMGMPRMHHALYEGDADFVERNLGLLPREERLQILMEGNAIRLPVLSTAPRPGVN